MCESRLSIRGLGTTERYVDPPGALIVTPAHEPYARRFELGRIREVVACVRDRPASQHKLLLIVVRPEEQLPSLLRGLLRMAVARASIWAEFVELHTEAAFTGPEGKQQVTRYIGDANGALCCESREEPSRCMGDRLVHENRLACAQWEIGEFRLRIPQPSPCIGVGTANEVNANGANQLRR